MFNATDTYKNIISSIEVGHILCFFAVVENGSISKAAASMNMTQATMSRTMQQLEIKLNLILFERHARGVRPTPAALMLYENWIQSMNMLIKGWETAYNIQKDKYQLNIAEYNQIRKRTYLVPILEEYEKQYPQVNISIDEIDHLEPEMLESGLYDVAFMPGFNEASVRNCKLLKYKVIRDLPHEALMHMNHPFSMKEEIDVDMLQNETILLGKGGYFKNWNSKTLEFLSLCGFEESTSNILYCDSFLDIRLKLLLNKAVFITTNLHDMYHEETLRAVPINGPHANLLLIWNRNIQSKYYQDFIKCALSK